MEEVVEFPEPNLKFTLREFRKPRHIVLQNLRDAHKFRTPRFQYNRTRRKRLFAGRKRIKRGNRLLLGHTRREFEFNPHLVAREVVELTHPHFFLLNRVFYGRGNGVRRLAPREFRYHELIFIFLLNAGTHFYLAESVLIVGSVHNAAELEVGIERKGLLLKKRNFRLKKFDEVMGQDCRRKSHRDTIRPEHQQKRNLRGQINRLFFSTVVIWHKSRRLLVEDFVPRKVRQTTLNITRRRVRHSRIKRAVVTLSVNQVALAFAPKLVGENTNRVTNGSVAVRMVLHRVTHDIGDLRVASVILLPEGMHNAPLDGLKAIFHSWDCTRTNYIR